MPTSPTTFAPTPSGTAASAHAVRLVSAWKEYGGVPVLRDVTVSLAHGAIHGFAGENGAGKSTCIGLMSGKTALTRGSVQVGGVDMVSGNPRRFLASGVSAVYQELTMIPQLTAVENVFIGIAPSRQGALDRGTMRRRYVEIMDRLQAAIPPTARPRELSTGKQQMLEIARALVRGSRVILFDEPTAALSLSEREQLLRVMRELRDDGVAMAVVTHDLEEMLQISDEVTVFRNGRLIESRPTEGWTRRDVVSAMAGAHPPEALIADRPRVEMGGRPSLLSLRGASIDGKQFTLDLDVRPGEIVGLAGLMGSGRSSLLKSLAGDAVIASGDITVADAPSTWPVNLAAARARGMQYLPEDRKTMGLMLGESAVRNILVGAMGESSFGPIVRPRKARDRAREVARRVRLREDVLDQPVARLSGGNQQKVLLGRALARPFRLLLADEPTRGVDVNAREEIWATIADVASKGAGALVVVSDIDELVSVTDRIVVIPRRGEAVTLPGRGASTRADVVRAMFAIGGAQPNNDQEPAGTGVTKEP